MRAEQVRRAARAVLREATGRGAAQRSWMHPDRSRALYERLGPLADRYAAAGEPGLPDLTRFELRVFSQNGEDGVIAEILARIGTSERFFVEFGIDGGAEGNCVFLADILGWRGTFIEPGDTAFGALARKYGGNDRVTLIKEAVRPDNIEALLGSAGVPPEPDLLSIDIDGNDYWVWEALSSYRPRLVVVEYNGALPLHRRLVMPYDPHHIWTVGKPYGASLAALEDLGARKGYRLVHTELAGVNAFFVRDDLVAGLPAPADVPRRGTNHWLLSADKTPYRGAAPLEDRFRDLDAPAPG